MIDSPNLAISLLLLAISFRRPMYRFFSLRQSAKKINDVRLKFCKKIFDSNFYGLYIISISQLSLYSERAKNFYTLFNLVFLGLIHELALELFDINLYFSNLFVHLEKSILKLVHFLDHQPISTGHKDIVCLKTKKITTDLPK
ncbi:hypothetical protein BpHYR1_010080 [Brachionus plicatilis]|uniref:Uncharacterized protein n=1 Tax=Brachionus plicatilis TaxID=10195 RepID=A0A3M7QSQ5_BRAPC|nr:hypothetical protein BpHYR1_010080 [Brachionus plicatilis]